MTTWWTDPTSDPPWGQGRGSKVPIWIFPLFSPSLHHATNYYIMLCPYILHRHIIHKNDPQTKPDLMVVFSDLQGHPDYCQRRQSLQPNERKKDQFFYYTALHKSGISANFTVGGSHHSQTQYFFIVPPWSCGLGLDHGEPERAGMAPKGPIPASASK